MSVTQQSQESTPSPRPDAIITDQNDPRNIGMEGGVTAQGQGIEHGCAARIGATVFDGMGPEGTIIGFTDQLVIFEDEEGHEYAQRYGSCTTPLAPPAELSEPINGKDEVELQGPALLDALWPDDRYRKLQAKAVALMLEVEEARGACAEKLVDDHDQLIRALEDFNLKASEIDDNRLADAIWQARQQLKDQLATKQAG